MDFFLNTVVTARRIRHSCDDHGQTDSNFLRSGMRTQNNKLLTVSLMTCTATFCGRCFSASAT